MGNKEKNAKHNDWQKNNTLRVNIAFTNNSGIPDALRKMSAETGITPPQYVRKAVIESLEFDGYWEEPLVHPWDK